MSDPSAPERRVPLPQAESRDASVEAVRVALESAGVGEVRFGRHDRMLYSTDASIYQVEPLGVVVPDSVESAARALEIVTSHGVPVLARGGGTSLAGQCTNRAVVVDTSARCCAVRELDPIGGTCRVEPGIPVDELNAALAPNGWFFAPDPATSRHACVGGCIGNNAAGARSVKYGRTSESVIGIDVWLAGGERVRLTAGAGTRDERASGLARGVAGVVSRHAGLIRERFPRTIRRNAGYGLDMVLSQLDAGVAPEALDLTPLLCGSEGTLAFTLGAHLRLHRLPAARGLAVVAFPSVDAAIAAVVPILGTSPSAVELLDDMVIGLARANAEYGRYVGLLPGGGVGVRAVLYVEYEAAGEAGELEEMFGRLRSVVPGAPVECHTSAASMQNAWKLRKAGEPLLHGIAGARKPVTFVEDNAVPVERLGEFVRRFREIVRGHGTEAAFFAHASVGVLHVRPLIDPRNPADRAVMQAIAVEVADLAKELGGVMSGEHGDGRVRSPLLERFYGPELVGAFREIKTLFDPGNLLNPGVIVAPLGVPDVSREIGEINRRTRIEPEGRAAVVPATYTHFDFSDQHGLGGAVEMCNGAGVCRKRSGGTMCPSYQATLDERHSTRGRGNALRLAITGQLGGGEGPAWRDAETLRTLDLCLSCKACKSECPSNVDIARLRAEYLAQGFAAAGGAPLKTRLFGSVRALNRAGSVMPRLSNGLAGSGLGRRLAGSVLGVHPSRSLPRFERSLGRRVDRGVARRPGELPPERPAVVLFGDCFSMYNETSVGLAAVRLIRAFGYSVGLADAGCCGRAKISCGLLREAAGEIAGTVGRLLPWARDERVAAIAVLEPSCLSAIRDDWGSLRTPAPGADIAAVAAKAEMLETFLDARWHDHLECPAWREGGEAVYHGHCHQRALWGAEGGAAVLRRVAGEGLRVLDTGCCGMAGSFGYARERYDLSMSIGELGVLPRVREAPEGVAVLAPGTSCRHQIAEGAGRRAQHPVEWLADRLAGAAS